MANHSDVQKLQTEFPDMSQSVLGDVLTSYKNDPKMAANALRGLSDQLQHENDAKIEELEEMFPNLPRDIIISELKSSSWNIDLAITPLFTRMQDIQQQEKRRLDEQQKKKREEDTLRKRREEMKHQANNLMDIFRSISKDRVQQLLDEYEGDIEETTAQLLRIVSTQEDEAKQAAKTRAEVEDRKRRHEQEMRLKDLKFQALKGKFEDLNDQQINAALESNDWEIQKALGELMLASIAKKREEIRDLFQSIGDEEIELALEENNHDKIKTVKALTLVREKRKIEEEQAIHLDSTQQDLVKKDKKRKNRRSRGRRSDRDDRKRKDSDASPSPASSPDSQPNVIISKVKQNALEKSVILGQMIEREIAANHKDAVREEERMKKTQQEDARALFRNNLEHIIETQARDNTLPGMIPPPTPKQIDNALGKNKPVVDIENPAASIQEKDLPDIRKSNSSESRSDSKPLVTLTINQQIVDVGNPITVDWEITSGVSSAWDWIGLFPVDKTNKQYVTFQWSGKQLMKGSLTFHAPTVYGEYEFRYFPNGYYEHATMSRRFKVGPQIELTGSLDKANNKIMARWNQTSGNLYSRSWIGLYEKSETNNNNYVSWEHASKPNTDVSFDAPFKPREYELRFFTNSYVDVARSQPIRIEGNDSIAATYENGMITVKLNVVTIDPYNESGWLGVFFTHETNNRQWRRYKYFSSRIGDCQFKAPRTAGEYEVRMFANKTYDMILKSNSFTIPAPDQK